MSEHATFEVLNPFDQSKLAEYPLVGIAEADLALDKAKALFDDQANWLAKHERIAICERVIEIMKSRVDELTRTAASEGGKPYADSKVEVIRAIDSVKQAKEHISQQKGEEVPMGINPASSNRMAFTYYEPIGVVAAICAFNHPLNLIVHQVITAVATGCPVIVKPAKTTPMSCLVFADILTEAGLSEGWCQPILCTNEAAEHLVTSPKIGFFTFIGSERIGWYLNSKLAPGTRSALEHGGAAPVIVEDSADVDTMVPSLVKGGFYHAGQVCVSVQRVFVEANKAQDIAQRIADAADKLVVGDPLDETTEVGPLILPKEVDRVAAWVDEAVEAGATLLCGGKKLSDTTYAPTVLLDPPVDAKVSTLEIFGPVVCVYSYTDRNQAIQQANDLPVHFQASVYTKNLDVALECVKKLNATAVMVNDHTAFRVDWMPFGGRDTSGLGMGGIQYTMDDMVREKMMVFKSDAL